MILITHWLIIVVSLIFIFVFIPILEGFERYRRMRIEVEGLRFKQVLKSVRADYRKYYTKYANSLGIQERYSIFAIPIMLVIMIAILPPAPSFNNKMLVASDLKASLPVLFLLISIYVFFVLKFQEKKLLPISALIILATCLICIIADSQNIKITEIVEQQIKIVDTQEGIFSFLPSWMIFKQPISFILFTLSSLLVFNQLSITSERNFRGLQIIKTQSLFVLACLIVVLFLGSWHFPGLPSSLSDNFSELSWIFLSLFIFTLKLTIVLIFLLGLKNTIFKFSTKTLDRIFMVYLLPISLIHLGLYLILS